MRQMRLIDTIEDQDTIDLPEEASYRKRLVALLSGNLDFHKQDSSYASHTIHPFPAKFPPQMPRTFINGLTEKGDRVLDPMMGSGTTILETFLTGRQAVGFDIDPLAILLTNVKTKPLDAGQAIQSGNHVLYEAKQTIAKHGKELQAFLTTRQDKSTRQFINYWFDLKTQIELLALIREIRKIPSYNVRSFLQLIFSGIIITKRGGVSLALDLAHTRPHRAKVVLNQAGEVILEQDLSSVSPKRAKILTKTLQSPIEEFGKRLLSVSKHLLNVREDTLAPYLSFGDAQHIALGDSSIDLIVTSPPYASNAIDYMRAHKFSLVWMGYPIRDLSDKRKEYIGGEAVSQFNFEDMPSRTAAVVKQITDVDEKKGLVLHRYYSEMTLVLREMFRILKPGKAAIVVVGSSTMRGLDTKTEKCLAEIGESLGFEVPYIGIRHLDRNRRMMPTGNKVNRESQIQQRMNEEYVIGYYKPEST